MSACVVRGLTIQALSQNLSLMTVGSKEMLRRPAGDRFPESPCSVKLETLVFAVPALGRKTKTYDA